MTEKEQVDILIYRIREQGLEVFMVPNQADNLLTTPTAEGNPSEKLIDQCIELDPVIHADGATRKAVAIEADWHEIPSLRALIYEDYRVAKEKAKNHLRNLLPDIENGAFVAVKEAFKRILPAQYAMLKELKEIINDKNQTKYI